MYLISKGKQHKVQNINFDLFCYIHIGCLILMIQHGDDVNIKGNLKHILTYAWNEKIIKKKTVLFEFKSKISTVKKV